MRTGFAKKSSFVTGDRSTVEYRGLQRVRGGFRRVQRATERTESKFMLSVKKPSDIREDQGIKV